MLKFFLLVRLFMFCYKKKVPQLSYGAHVTSATSQAAWRIAQWLRLRSEIRFVLPFIGCEILLPSYSVAVKSSSPPTKRKGMGCGAAEREYGCLLPLSLKPFYGSPEIGKRDWPMAICWCIRRLAKWLGLCCRLSGDWKRLIIGVQLSLPEQSEYLFCGFVRSLAKSECSFISGGGGHRTLVQTTFLKVINELQTL